MKKIFGLGIIIIMILLQCSCDNIHNDTLEPFAFKNMQEISLEEYVKLIEKKELSIAVICDLYGTFDKNLADKMDQIQLELDIPIYFLSYQNILNEKKDNYEIYLKYLDTMNHFTDIYLKDNKYTDSLYKITPIITIFENQKEKSVLVSDRTYEEIKKWILSQIN